MTPTLTIDQLLVGATHLGHRRWMPPPDLEPELREGRAHSLQAHLLRYRVNQLEAAAWPGDADRREVRRLLRLAERHEVEKEWRLKLLVRAMELAPPAAMLVWRGPGDPPAREGVDWTPVYRPP